ncbi:MAG TPA: META domain-containing protein [Flavobacterium sp.]|jgi:heat shock protein HslJ/uncharacterized membrane protein
MIAKTKLLSCFIIAVMAISCSKKVAPKEPEKTKAKTAAVQSQPIDEKSKRERAAFLRIKGEDPFWSVEVSQQSIKFMSVNASESFEVPYTAPISTEKTKIYRSKGTTHELEISITPEKCKGIVLEPDFVTTVKYRKIGDPEFETISACTKKILDPRLNYVWKLHEINGIKVTPEDFGKELPYIDLHIKEDAFTGFAGCNRIKGVLVMEEGSGLQFKGIIATKMSCLAGNKENLVMTALQNADKYEIKNGRLYIYQGKVLIASFTKAT